MSAVVFLLIALAISAVGTGWLYMRSRSPSPSAYDAGIEDFRREMQALAPRDEPVPARRRWRR